MVSRPVVSSMRSRQTGQVGSSTRDAVGGAIGFAVSDGAMDGASIGDDTLDAGNGAVGCLAGVGVKGSLARSGYDEGSRFEASDWKVMDLMKTT